MSTCPFTYSVHQRTNAVTRLYRYSTSTDLVVYGGHSIFVLHVVGSKKKVGFRKSQANPRLNLSTW